MERNIRWPHLPGHNKTTFATAFPQKWFLPPPSPIKTKAGPFNCHSCLKEIFGGFDQSWLYPRPICAYHYSDLLCSSMYQEGLHPRIIEVQVSTSTAFSVQTTAVLFSMSWHQGIKEKDANQAPPPNLPLCIANVVSKWYLNLKCWLL